MSIDDIQYLKSNSFKQNYTFLIDSKDRDYIKNPHPNHYTIEFTTPFRNVFGLEVLDASVPRTMYNVDVNNNILYYYVEQDANITTQQLTLNLINQNIQFNKIEFETGDFSLSQLIQHFNNIIPDITIESLSTPPEVKNKVKFISSKQFIFDMNNSTIRNVFGFNLSQNVSSGFFTSIVEPSIISDINKFRFFISKKKDNNYEIEPPGIIDLIGEKYVILNCPEIEAHSSSSLSYSKHSLGLARFKLGTLGYNDESISINKTKIREFHPIGKFSKMTLQFINQSGKFYDFKGANHNIMFNIHYYQTNTDIQFDKSILNPNYNPNILTYKMNLLNNQDSESDSDSDNDDNMENKLESVMDNSYLDNFIEQKESSDESSDENSQESSDENSHENY